MTVWLLYNHPRGHDGSVIGVYSTRAIAETERAIRAPVYGEIYEEPLDRIITNRECLTTGGYMRTCELGEEGCKTRHFG